VEDWLNPPLAQAHYGQVRKLSLPGFSLRLKQGRRLRVLLVLVPLGLILLRVKQALALAILLSQ
jgi:hypothetical protein